MVKVFIGGKLFVCVVDNIFVIIVILISIVSFKIEEGRERKLFIVNLRFNLFILCINIKVIVVFLELVLE